MEITTAFILDMALACQEAGADFFWIAEPTGAIVSPQHFQRYCGPYLQTIFERIDIPGFLHIPGNTNHLLGEMIKTKAQGLSLDSFINFRNLLQDIPRETVLMGNINSLSLLNDSTEKISQAVEKLNQQIKNFPNVIVSSGGGLAPDTPEANLRALFTMTRKTPVWSADQYRLINQLWPQMTAPTASDISPDGLKNYAPPIIMTSLEEALAFLGQKQRQNQISRHEYVRQAQKIFQLLDAANIHHNGPIYFEGKMLTPEQLKADFAQG